jgi:potassium/hydrogen antiporter
VLNAQPPLLAAAILLLAGVLLSKTSSRFGVPSLLLFLFLGMVAGSEGLLGIEFEDFQLAQEFGVISLAFILFAGGLSTDWPDIRNVIAPGVALATVGVLLTALVLGFLASAIFGLDPLTGMLLGAVIGSTDAAAVFSILRSHGMGVRGRLGPLLELESGSNDPAAVFLTVGIIGLIQATGPGVAGLVGLFFVQMAIGAAAGLLLARGAVQLINRLKLEYDGLYPVLTVAFVLLTYEGTALIGGNGFLATYVAGLTLSSTGFLHKRSLMRFHDAIAWLMQISMFVVFGLLVFPSRLVPVAGEALLIAALLIFVARPFAVAVTLAPFRLRVRDVAFVSWVGLRGATPIILATFPVVAGVGGAETIFNVVFFVVLMSVLVQGTTIPAAARLLRVDTPDPPPRSYALEAVLSGHSGHDLHEVLIPQGSRAVDVPVVNLGLPEGVLIVLLQRGGDYVVPQGGTPVRTGDRVLVLADGEALLETRRLLQETGE